MEVTLNFETGLASNCASVQQNKCAKVTGTPKVGRRE